jgi:hypothetical protein
MAALYTGVQTGFCRRQDHHRQVKESAMPLDTAVMTAVESLDYRVTVGDVAAKAGLNLEIAQQGLIALAADTQAHLQVSEAGEIAYEFPQNFRSILRNRYWRLRFQETWQKIWRVLFYLIRISFGILLILSIVLIVAAIAVLDDCHQLFSGRQ